MENIKEQIDEEIEESVDRKNLNLQQFMNDMRMLGDQVNSKELSKPTFHYGDLAITNYLLWLLLGELTILNDNLEEED